MWETCDRQRLKMSRRGVENDSKNGSKWSQNDSKMAPWRPLGGLGPERRLLGRSWDAPGPLLGRSWVAPGPLLAAPGQLLGPPGRPREGPRGAPGGDFGIIFVAGPGGTKKVR